MAVSLQQSHEPCVAPWRTSDQRQAARTRGLAWPSRVQASRGKRIHGSKLRLTDYLFRAAIDLRRAERRSSPGPELLFLNHLPGSRSSSFAKLHSLACGLDLQETCESQGYLNPNLKLSQAWATGRLHAGSGTLDLGFQLLTMQWVTAATAGCLAFDFPCFGAISGPGHNVLGLAAVGYKFECSLSCKAPPTPQLFPSVPLEA
jgi:hypothetical protein